MDSNTFSRSSTFNLNGGGLWLSILLGSLSAIPAEAFIDINAREGDGISQIIRVLPDAMDAKIENRDDLNFDRADSKSVQNLDDSDEPTLNPDEKFKTETPEVLSASPQLAEANAALIPETAPLAFDGSLDRRRNIGNLIREGAERVSVLAGRAATLPAHFWPLSNIAAVIAHGEPLVGLTPSRAAAQAARIAKTDHVGVTVGRLSWYLRDRWSTRGAERSYSSLIERMGQEKRTDPSIDLSVSLDLETLGLQSRELSPEARVVATASAAWRLARKAAANGIKLEIDMGGFDMAPKVIWIARWLAQQSRLPVRLALPARYPDTEQNIADWSALARTTGLRLGIRLVKGSYIDAELPNQYNERRPLLDRYKSLVSLALSHSNELDIAIASQNEEIWEHARQEAQRLGAAYEMHTINGVNMHVQEKMKAAGKLGRVYVSYGSDAPMFGLMEMLSNWWQRLKISMRSPAGQLD